MFNTEEKEAYTKLSGILDSNNLQNDSKIYIETDSNIYEMTPQMIEDESFGFSGYIEATIPTDTRRYMSKLMAYGTIKYYNKSKIRILFYSICSIIIFR